MGDEFKYRCRRRRARVHSEMEQSIVDAEPSLGAGSGGDGDNIHYFDGFYFVAASKLCMNAVGTTLGGDADEPPYMSLVAGDEKADGIVEVHGSKGVRVTSGLPGQPPAANFQIKGVEIQTGDTQTILLARGMDQNPMCGHINMALDGIGINANQGGVWIKSLTQIKLMVAGGTSSITLTPAGIVMQGPLIQIN